MKKNFLFLFFIILGVLGVYFTFSKITKQQPKNYNSITYNEIIAKKRDGHDFILFVKKDGCIHCENVEPLINEFVNNNKTDVLAVTSNKEKKQKKLISNLKVTLYPTIIFFENGVEKARLVGEFSEKELNKMSGELEHAFKEKN